ncbi:MAG TPA: F0F1 ATP synthase subunit A [Pyrinomonadaceae bacterium]
MYWLQEKVAEQAPAQEHAEHMPIIVQLVNHYFGDWAYNFEMHYTYPLWSKFFANFHTTPEAVFGPYSPETAIPWYTVMFFIACLLSVAIVWILKGELSRDEPGHGQQALELGVLVIRDMLADIIGPHGLKYFPVVMTFAVLILVSNLMGLFPLFMSPTAAVSVTFALGITSFVYYNYIGIKENGLLGHLKHWAGPVWWIAPLIFPIELISNFIRPFSLGIRLFGNMFADEQVSSTVAGLYPAITHWGLPVLLMPLGVFVAFIQTFVFVLLSQLYLSEVSHSAHEEHAEHEDHAAESELHAGGEQLASAATS